MARCINILFAVASCFIALPWAESNDLFISIDCGGTDSYGDPSGLQWVGDAGLIPTGKIGAVQKSNNLYRPWINLRYFPTGKKNCYSIPGIPQGSKTLVRAVFYYGNYDGLSAPPTFDLQFDGNPWETVKTRPDVGMVYEMVYVTNFENVSICVARTGEDSTPFISTLEFRVLPSTMYGITDPKHPLITVARTVFGAPSNFKFPDDPHDRIWFSYTAGTTDTNVTSTCNNFTIDLNDDPPPAALKHAITTLDSTAGILSIPIYYLPPTPDLYYFTLYFSEVVLSASRSFTVVLDTRKSSSLSPPYGGVHEVYCTNCSMSSSSDFYLSRTSTSSLPPIINAMELFRISPALLNGTNTQDVSGLKVLQDGFPQLQLWTGDPCLPLGFNWEWVSCSSDIPARVTALYLNGSGLNASLPDFSALSALQIIDLSNNNLTGQIPEFLGHFPNLKELNLAYNCFSGSPPTSLTTNPYLKLNVSGSDSCPNSQPHPHKRIKKKLIAGVTVGSIMFLLLLPGIIVLFRICLRRLRQPLPPLQPSSVSSSIDHSGQEMMPSLQSGLHRAFTYAEIVEITANFQNLVGKGGSGEVYYGRLKDGTEVAVKVLRDSHPRGNAEFVREVRLLMKIHHRNLAPFVGFCEEGRNMIVLYEYMHNGNLGEVLSGRKATSEHLTWKKRLEIALDVATGLEYLHSGCQDTIIHRDVKPANILLNERLQAKLADFGISKVGDQGTQASIAGTPGYIDPEIAETGIATTKSDVYSFGVVLFDLICGKSVRSDGDGERVHIVTWATSKIASRDIATIVDPRIQGQFNTNGMWKVSELAMACTARRSPQRPDMHDVLYQLKEALEMEICGSESSMTGAMPYSSLSTEPPVPYHTEYTTHPSPR